MANQTATSHDLECELERDRRIAEAILETPRAARPSSRAKGRKEVTTALSAIAAPAAPLRFPSPFKLVEPSTIVAADGLAPVPAAALIARGVASGARAIARYRRGDLEGAQRRHAAGGGQRPRRRSRR